MEISDSEILLRQLNKFCSYANSRFGRSITRPCIDAKDSKIIMATNGHIAILCPRSRLSPDICFEKGRFGSKPLFPDTLGVVPIDFDTTTMREAFARYDLTEKPIKCDDPTHQDPDYWCCIKCDGLGFIQELSPVACFDVILDYRYLELILSTAETLNGGRFRLVQKGIRADDCETLIFTVGVYTIVVMPLRRSPKIDADAKDPFAEIMLEVVDV